MVCYCQRLKSYFDVLKESEMFRIVSGGGMEYHGGKAVIQ